MQSFKEFLLVSESLAPLAREIDKQLEIDLVKEFTNSPLGSLDDFAKIIKDVTRKQVRLFMDNVKDGFVETVEFHPTKANAGYFLYRPNQDLVYFGFQFNEPMIIRFIESSKIDKSILRSIIQTISHELVHAIQFDRSKLRSQGGREQKIAKGFSGVENYYASPAEIEAYAYNAVQELYAAGIDLEKLFATLNKSANDSETHKMLLGVMRSHSTSFNNYKTMFSGGRISRASKKVWKTFIKKFIEHLKVTL